MNVSISSARRPLEKSGIRRLPQRGGDSLSGPFLRVVPALLGDCHLQDFENVEAQRQKSCEEAETDSRAKFGKETVAGAHRRPKWVPHYVAQADSGRAQDAQALLRLCSGLLRSAQVCSG
jgi:hypothetical protein